MSGEGSRIDVHINVNDAAVSTERLNRSIRNLPAGVTGLDTKESADPTEPTDFRIDGEITGRCDAETPIPDEIYVVGRVVEIITRDTPCFVRETAIESSDMERSFTLYGHINP
jgi:hypothetical protein